MLRRNRLTVTRIDIVARCIQRPERIPEEVLRIVLSLDLAKSFPVVPETSFNTLTRLVAAKELNEGTRQARLSDYDAIIDVNE